MMFEYYLRNHILNQTEDYISYWPLSGTLND